MRVQQFDVVLDEGDRNVLVKGRASYGERGKKTYITQDRGARDCRDSSGKEEKGRTYRGKRARDHD